MKKRINYRSKVLKKKRILTLILAISVVSSSLIIGISLIPSPGSNDTIPAGPLTVTEIPGFPLLYQHKDTVMQCTVPPDGAFAHPGFPTDIWGADMTYGTMDDEPHCSAYCAPGSIAMIATFRNVVAPMNQQDDIYDAGKSVWGGEVAKGDSIINTHGVGMFDGSPPGMGLPHEVQDSFQAALGAFTQHDWWGQGNVSLNATKLQDYIVTWHPVLWLDHGGFPVNQSPLYPDNQALQGHAKVITGYNDCDTPGDFSDDLVLIYDPWPEYNHRNILPVNATQYAPGVFDPYWLPLNDVNLSDPLDIFLVDHYPDIPEFAHIIIPIMGTLIMAMIAGRWSSRKQQLK